ncbi:MAG: hypothetical protein ACRDTH_21840 [Pseudonocardiaceae bacterium]
MRREPDMIVDCDRCEVRGSACQDCVITVLLGAPPGGVELDGAEQRALDTLAEAGMVPRLQLVNRGQHHNGMQAETGAHVGTGGERSATSGERSSRCVC